MAPAGRRESIFGAAGSAAAGYTGADGSFGTDNVSLVPSNGGGGGGATTVLGDGVSLGRPSAASAVPVRADGGGAGGAGGGGMTNEVCVAAGRPSCTTPPASTPAMATSTVGSRPASCRRRPRRACEAARGATSVSVTFDRVWNEDPTAPTPTRGSTASTAVRPGSAAAVTDSDGSLEFTVSGLTNGTTYAVEVRGVSDTAGCRAGQPALNAHAGRGRRRADNVVVTGGPSSVTFTFDAPTVARHLPGRRLHR